MSQADPTPAPAGPTPVIFDDAPVDPLYYLMLASVTTQEKELGIQGAVANVSNAWSEGALANVQAGDLYIEHYASLISGAATGAPLAAAQSAYQVAQTTVSTTNQDYSNVVQGGTTSLSSLTQVQSQNLQFCNIVQANMDSINSLITTWGS